MAYKFKNLVFEGGGVKGIAYVGALEVLEKEQILGNIKRVAGTSAGAMVAVLIGLGYSAEELKDILWKINFRNFLDICCAKNEYCILVTSWPITSKPKPMMAKSPSKASENCKRKGNRLWTSS